MQPIICQFSYHDLEKYKKNEKMNTEDESKINLRLLCQMHITLLQDPIKVKKESAYTDEDLIREKLLFNY